MKEIPQRKNSDPKQKDEERTAYSNVDIKEVFGLNVGTSKPPRASEPAKMMSRETRG